MGMFTSGAYDSFKNRQQEHRKNRAGARKDYNDWLTSQREAGIDVTSEMATNQFANIADNDYNIMTGAPTKMEMGAQLTANNTAARDIRASKEEEAFKVTDQTNSRWQSEIENAYQVTNDTASAFKLAATKFENSPAMLEGFNSYVSSISDPNAHRNQYLSDYMMKPSTRTMIAGLVDDGITDYSKFNKNATDWMKEAINPILTKKDLASQNAAALLAYQEFAGDNGPINLEDFKAVLKIRGITNDPVINQFTQRSEQHNERYYDTNASDQITRLLNNPTSEITDATAKKILANVTASEKQILMDEIKDHNQKVQTSADLVKSAKMKSDLSLANPNVKAIIENQLLTPLERVSKIQTYLGYDPTSTKDTISNAAIQQFVLDNISGMGHKTAQSYEVIKNQQTQAASTMAAQQQQKGDKALNTKLESLFTKDLDTTQQQMLTAVISGLEPYYVDSNDVTTLGAVQRSVKADIDDGSFSPEEIIARASKQMTTDGQFAQALKQQASLDSGPMPVAKFMIQWKTHMEDFDESAHEILAYADSGLSFNDSDIIAPDGSITEIGKEALHVMPEAIRDLMHSIKSTQANIADLYNQVNPDNLGMFTDAYMIREKMSELQEMQTKQEAYVKDASKKLAALQQKYEAARSKVSRGSSGSLTSGPVKARTTASQDFGNFVNQSTAQKELRSMAQKLATGFNGQAGTSPVSQAWDYFTRDMTSSEQEKRELASEIQDFLKTQEAVDYLAMNPQTTNQLQNDPFSWYILAKQ